MAALSSFLFLSIFLSYSLLIDGQSPGDLRLIRDGVSRLSYSYGRLQVEPTGGRDSLASQTIPQPTVIGVDCRLGNGLCGETREGGAGSIVVSPLDLCLHWLGDVGSVSISEVNCYGNSEYLHLLRCSYKKGFHTCQQNFVTLYCNTTNNPPYDGQLRLLYGTTSSN
uniref:SRCR domain-containing protein n=1 Tax=Amphimedon queenslandica TaxID=400682 RepID=A0A1X7SX26_AMPQE